MWGLSKWGNLGSSAAWTSASVAASLVGLHDAMTLTAPIGSGVTSWSGSVAGGPIYTPISVAPLLGSKNGLRYIEDTPLGLLDGQNAAMVTTTATNKLNRRVFIVARPDAVASLAQRPLYGTSGASSQHIGARFNVGNLAAINLYGATAHVGPTVPPAGLWALFEFDLRPDGFTIFINGVEDLAVTAAQGAIMLNTLLGGVHGGVNFRYHGAISMVTEYDTSRAVMSAGQVGAARAAGMFRAGLLNSPQLSYAFTPEDDGSFGVDFRTVGALTAGTLLTLDGGNPLPNVATVGSVVRTGGAKNTASVYFATDADYLGYRYTMAPVVDAVGFALSLMIPDAETTGRIAHTTAVGSSGFRVEVIAGVLWATANDGSVEITASRTIAPAEFGVRMTVAAAMGPFGLLLCAGNDVEADVIVSDRLTYVGPTADELLIGGAGITIFGGALYSPQPINAADLVALKGGTSSGLAWSVVSDPVFDETASTNVFFSNITDGEVKFRLATILATGSLVTTSAGRVEVEAMGEGGSGAGTIGGQPGGGGGAGEYVRAFVELAAGTHSITIGSGSVATSNGDPGLRGAATTLFSLTALGGGGGVKSASAPDPSLSSGGSGGGMGAGGTSRGLSIAADGVGFDGGFGKGGYQHSGGGGGASQAGGWSAVGAGPANEGGKGGDGITSTFSGVSISLGGGGGGGVNAEPGTGVVPGAGGLGGGGVGGTGGGTTTAIAAGSGVVNTGGGGGGSGKSSAAAGGGGGGSGVARVRWPFEWDHPTAGMTLTRSATQNQFLAAGSNVATATWEADIIIGPGSVGVVHGMGSNDANRTGVVMHLYGGKIRIDSGSSQDGVAGSMLYSLSWNIPAGADRAVNVSWSYNGPEGKAALYIDGGLVDYQEFAPQTSNIVGAPKNMYVGKWYNFVGPDLAFQYLVSNANGPNQTQSDLGYGVASFTINNFKFYEDQTTAEVAT